MDSCLLLFVDLTTYIYSQSKQHNINTEKYINMNFAYFKIQYIPQNF